MVIDGLMFLDKRMTDGHFSPDTLKFSVINLIEYLSLEWSFGVQQFQ